MSSVEVISHRALNTHLKNTNWAVDDQSVVSASEMCLDCWPVLYKLPVSPLFATESEASRTCVATLAQVMTSFYSSGPAVRGYPIRADLYVQLSTQ